MSIVVRVKGIDYGGWKTARVSRGVENMAGTFSATVSNLWPGRTNIPEIHAFDKCSVLVDGEAVLVGHVEKLVPSYDKGNHQITFMGVSKTGDLVDCAAISGQGQMIGVTILEVARVLCAPFGISVRAEAPTGSVIPNFQISPGDTVFECLGKLAKERGLYLTDDANGNLVITKSGTSSASGRIVNRLDGSGNNVLSARGGIDVSQRFSEYHAKGTSQRFVSNDSGSENTTGIAVDSDVPRYRPTVLNVEGDADAEVTQKRADWEASNRLARSMGYSYTVQGWRQTPGGPLWVPNQTVPVIDETMKINGSFLVSNVDFQISDNGGSTTVLKVVPPDSFEPAPAVSAANSGSSSEYILAPE
ncbi:MAG: hypothetical protein COA62_15650 [Rhodobiaceae bacterium]|nr:MAG: hypothetical protein COA62_15650 [Rhodobiaceae bacterium]